MKYIIYKISDEEQAIVFPEEVTHKSVVHNLRGENRVTLISAGFVYRKHGVMWVEREAESLNLRSRREDVPIIKRSILQ